MARSYLTTLATDSEPAAIEAAAKLGRPWQVLVALGDAYYDRKDYVHAVPVYEEALDDIRDVVANPKAPPKDVEERVYKRAVEARALAPTFVATRAFRGKKTGLADPNFRNFTAETVPVPVRFDYDSADLTPDGEAAVKDIYTYLEQSAPEHVVIIGHTDPRGSDAYNRDLSERRAASVKDYLVSLGYKAARSRSTAEARASPSLPTTPRSTARTSSTPSTAASSTRSRTDRGCRRLRHDAACRVVPSTACGVFLRRQAVLRTTSAARAANAPRCVWGAAALTAATWRRSMGGEFRFKLAADIKDDRSPALSPPSPALPRRPHPASGRS